tara:strand:+ start:8704 stop:9183 length:480 start_codon:yes stop_codon:yes gene_type:complete
MKLEYEDLLGRKFDLGRQDCATLTQEFYLNNFGIKISNYARPTDWDSKTLDIIGMSYEREGFFKVVNWETDLHPADVLCMAIGSSVANHYAVYLGGNEIIHHMLNGRSVKEPLRGYYRNATRYVLRHPDLVSLKEAPLPTTTVEELLNERNHPKPGASN